MELFCTENQCFSNAFKTVKQSVSSQQKKYVNNGQIKQCFTIWIKGHKTPVCINHRALVWVLIAAESCWMDVLTEFEALIKHILKLNSINTLELESYNLGQAGQK